MIEKSHGKILYDNIVSKKIYIIIFLVIAIAVSFIVNIFVGSAGLSLRETIASIFGYCDPVNYVIVWDIRMPVALSAILIGVALGVGGCEMQTILNNPMASPYTLGISSAASFGAALVIILNIHISALFDSILISLCAFFFSMLASFTIFTFSKKFNWDRGVLILFGIALNFLFNSLTTFLQFIADENDLQSFVFWSFGDLTKITWQQILILFIVVTVIYLLFFKKSWQLTAVTLGDSAALSLGIDVKKLRRRVIVMISVLSATSVSFAGTIGFVGIVAPHIARMLAGEDQRFLLPISALVGALMLSVASILGKVLVPGVILPIGLVTSVVGIPFFIYLILQHRGGVK